MTTGGWIWMVASLLLVWGGCFWCFKKVLTTDPETEHVPPGYGP